MVAAASAIALGTYSGGWRIIRTMGMRIIKMDPAQGFSPTGAGAAVILASSHFGYPLSTTQVISGAVMGAGAGKRLSAVRWGVAGNIVTAWLLTLPAAAALGAAVYGFCSISGTGAAGPIVVAAAGLAMVAAAFTKRVRVGSPVPTPRRAMLATIVDTEALLKTIVAAFIAGVGVTLIFSLAILGASRFVDLSRDGRSAGAIAFGALAVVALLAALVAITVGVIVMTRK